MRRGGSRDSPTARTRSTRSRSFHWPLPSSPVQSGSSTSAAAMARSVALPPASAREVIGIDPTWNCVSVAAQRGGASFARSEAATLPFADASFDAVVACLVFEHIRDVDEAIAEVSRVLQPGGRFCFFLNHPLLQTPNSGWIDDYVLDPPEQYWRIGAVPGRAGERRGGGEGRVHPLHPSSVQPVCQHPRRERPVDRADARACSTGRIPRASPASTSTRRRIPRLLYLRTRKSLGNTMVSQWPTSC